MQAQPSAARNRQNDCELEGRSSRLAYFYCIFCSVCYEDLSLRSSGSRIGTPYYTRSHGCRKGTFRSRDQSAPHCELVLVGQTSSTIQRSLQRWYCNMPVNVLETPLLGGINRIRPHQVPTLRCFVPHTCQRWLALRSRLFDSSLKSPGLWQSVDTPPFSPPLISHPTSHQLLAAPSTYVSSVSMAHVFHHCYKPELVPL